MSYEEVKKEIERTEKRKRSLLRALVPLNESFKVANTRST